MFLEHVLHGALQEVGDAVASGSVTRPLDFNHELLRGRHGAWYASFSLKYVPDDILTNLDRSPDVEAFPKW